MNRGDKMTMGDSALSSLENRANAGFESYRDDKERDTLFSSNFFFLSIGQSWTTSLLPANLYVNPPPSFVISTGIKAAPVLGLRGAILRHPGVIAVIWSGSRCTP